MNLEHITDMEGLRALCAMTNVRLAKYPTYYLVDGEVVYFVYVTNAFERVRDAVAKAIKYRQNLRAMRA